MGDRVPPNRDRVGPWFAFLFVLYLFAGRYKADPRLAWVPVDLTALTFAMSAMLGGVLWLRRWGRATRRGYSIAVVAVLFCAYAALSILWSSGRDYASEKAFYMATLVLWSAVAPALILATSRARVQSTYTAIVLVAVWFSLEVLAARGSTDAGRSIRALSGNYLGTGRTIGMAVAVLGGWSLAPGRPGWRRALTALCTLAMLGVLLQIGGRGPFLAAAVAFVVPVAVAFRIAWNGSLRVRRYVVAMAVAAILAVAAVGTMMSQKVDMATVQRLALLMDDQPSGAPLKRIDHYVRASGLWQTAPVFGYGIGAWPVLIGGEDERDYPHNIALELLVELGLVGLTIFLALLAICCVPLASPARLRGDPAALIAAMLIANTLVNAALSGSLTDNRALFAALGLAAVPMPGARPVTRTVLA